MAILPRAELDALREAADHARSMADYRNGKLTGLKPAQALALVEAPSPLAFWRKFRGFTQAQLTGAVGRPVGQGDDGFQQREPGARGTWEQTAIFPRRLDIRRLKMPSMQQKRPFL